MSGHFITFEGGEGAGKTTIIKTLKGELQELGFDVITTREPGGIEIAEQIRTIILDSANVQMDKRTEALLYAAARRQHLVEKVIPALNQNKVVLCDRFIDSSLAYQGYARGLEMEEIFEINQFAIKDMMPHLTLFFDIEPKKGLARIASNKDRERNRLDLENIKFHERVYEGYQVLMNKFPKRICRINADQRLQSVEKDTLNCIISFLQN